jgi:carboxypeptidase T
VTSLTASPDLVAAGSAVALNARIDDSRFNQANSTEPVQNIASASVFLDGLPWEGAVPVAVMSAADGAFDSSAENVSASVSTTGLSSGKHLVFVQGTDASATAGSPNATFIEVAQPSEIATLKGTVTASVGGAPLATTIHVNIPGSGEDRTALSDPGNGDYLRPMHAGTADIHVDAPPGFLPEDITGVSLAAGATQTRDIALLSACTVFEDDVESGSNGWTAQSPWVRSNSVSDHSGYAWATPNYGNNLNSSLSRSIDFSGSSGSSLDFDDRCDTEANYDYGRVEVSVNAGSNWTTVYQCSGRATWQHNRIILPASTDNVADVRLRFRLSSDVNTTRPGGWAVDNIVIESDPVLCRAAQIDHIFDNGFD